MNEPRIYPLILLTEARWSWILTALQFGISFRALLPVLGGPLILFKQLLRFCVFETIQTQRTAGSFSVFWHFKYFFPPRFQVWGFHRMRTTYWWCVYLHIRFENQQRIDPARKNHRTLLIPAHTYDINIAPWWLQNQYKICALFM